MRVLLVMYPLLFSLSVCYGYRLLGVFPLSFKSHFILMEQLMKGLVIKGHQIDMISPYPLKQVYPYYNDIVKLTSTIELTKNITYDSVQSKYTSFDVVYNIAVIMGNDLCTKLGNPEIQVFARNLPKDPPYDAVIMEVFSAHCFGIFAHLWDVPLIGRLYNTVHTVCLKFYFDYLTRAQNEMIRKHFGPDMPSVRELESKLALILTNSDISLNVIQPKVPAAVDVGGLHVQDESLPLQPELEKWMNDSKDGFIYITFGSMVVIETFLREFLNVLYASLGKIAPVRVVMKILNPERLPPGLPKNIYTFPWMPQVTILKHPNIKAFITHGGGLGTQEAITCCVPMIGIPLFADQFMNIDSYVARNIAVKLDFRNMTEKDMDAALNAILWDPIYREAARNLSRRYLDRPLNAIDNANYWIKYVIKYGGDAL